MMNVVGIRRLEARLDDLSQERAQGASMSHAPELTRATLGKVPK
jgi:hypothetical protein